MQDMQLIGSSVGNIMWPICLLCHCSPTRFIV